MLDFLDFKHYRPLNQLTFKAPKLLPKWDLIPVDDDPDVNMRNMIRVIREELHPFNKRRDAQGKFNMRHFSNGNQYMIPEFFHLPTQIRHKQQAHICGSSACMVGYTPMVFEIDREMVDNNLREATGDMAADAEAYGFWEYNWRKVSDHVFGLPHAGENWEWLFGGMWGENQGDGIADNTLLGAAARMEYFLDNGNQAPDAGNAMREGRMRDEYAEIMNEHGGYDEEGDDNDA